MRTNREFVSRIMNDFKVVSKDGELNRRHVLSIGKEKSAFLIAQKWDELKMSQDESLITHINCLEFESIDLKICDIFEFRLCRKLMKSVKQIPELIYGKSGPAILYATTVDGEIDFQYINPREFNAVSKRKYVIRDTNFFYVKDGYVYLPNSGIELLDISVISLDKKGAEDCSSCDTKATDSEPCTSIWEYDFICPDRLYDMVASQTLQELGSIWAGSSKDEKPNLNSNEKT